LTLKITDNQYGRLSIATAGLLVFQNYQSRLGTMSGKLMMAYMADLVNR